MSRQEILFQIMSICFGGNTTQNECVRILGYLKGKKKSYPDDMGEDMQILK